MRRFYAHGSSCPTQQLKKWKELKKFIAPQIKALLLQSQAAMFRLFFNSFSILAKGKKTLIEC